MKNLWIERRKHSRSHDDKIAICLENQRIWDEVVGCDHVELAKEVYQHFIGFDLASVQPMSSPAFNIYFLKFNNRNGKVVLELSNEESAVKSRILKNTDPQDIANEMNREIITDLRNNVSTVANRQCMNPESIYLDILEMNSVQQRKMLRSNLKKWIVTGQEIAELLTGKRCSSFGVQSLGVYCRAWNLFVDPLYPSKEIMVGFQDDLLDGYFYNPYITLTNTLTNLEHKLVTRYSKKLISPKPYGKIVYKVN